MPLLNMTQYAAHRGVSKMAVSKAVKAGRIQCVDGKIDRDAADAAWSRNTRVNLAEHQKSAPVVGVGFIGKTTPKGGTSAPAQDRGPAPGSLAHAQLVKETAKAKREAWRSQIEEKSLIEVAKVESKWAEVGARVKDEVMALPTRIVNRLPEEWRRMVSSVVAEEARRALAAIHHEFCSDRAAA